jgi:hypothetical protein
MGHSKVLLMFKKVPLIIFWGILENASFTYAPKSFWDTLNKVPLIEFNLGHFNQSATKSFRGILIKVPQKFLGAF